MTVSHVLLGLLADGPAHGYDLKRLHDERFAGSRGLAYGQVYTALAKLERDGFVEVAGVVSDGGPERTTYAITAAGRGALEAWLATHTPSGVVGMSAMSATIRAAPIVEAGLPLMILNAAE